MEVSGVVGASGAIEGLEGALLTGWHELVAPDGVVQFVQMKTMSANDKRS